MVWMRKYGLLVLVSLLLVGEIIGFAVLVPLAGKVAAQAQDGQEAKRTQCLRNPVSQKLALAAYAVRRSLPPESRVTLRELEDFKRTRPKGCAPHPK